MHAAMSAASAGPQSHPVAAIVLAAGEGTRMGTPGIAKVCHEVAPGVPAIRYLLDQLSSAGVAEFAVVTGAHADQVEAALASTLAVTFAFQPERRGTGDATLLGARALARRHLSAIVVAMGDKVTTAAVVRRLLDAHFSAGAALTLAVSPHRPDNEQGRVVVADDGSVLGIVEVPDLVAARAMVEIRRLFSGAHAVHPSVLREVIAHFLPPSGKVPKVLRRLWDAAHEEETLAFDRLADLSPGASPTLHLPGHDLAPDWVAAHTPFVNEAFYVFSPPALDLALAGLDAGNAQGELYLTDAVALLRARGLLVQVVPLAVGEVVGFNTPEELAAVRAAVAGWSER
jgi:bifunctional N-acetylglucosamine-1-phosphate-uridyltransferase/glucosamine-1-phosphate-acetyltransferase GlmU-like protein